MQFDNLLGFAFSSYPQTSVPYCIPSLNSHFRGECHFFSMVIYLFLLHFFFSIIVQIHASISSTSNLSHSRCRYNISDECIKWKSFKHAFLKLESSIFPTGGEEHCFQKCSLTMAQCVFMERQLCDVLRPIP